jgi:hypothetical protein
VTSRTLTPARAPSVPPILMHCLGLRGHAPLQGDSYIVVGGLMEHDEQGFKVAARGGQGSEAAGLAALRVLDFARDMLARIQQVCGNPTLPPGPIPHWSAPKCLPCLDPAFYLALGS